MAPGPNENDREITISKRLQRFTAMAVPITITTTITTTSTTYSMIDMTEYDYANISSIRRYLVTLKQPCKANRYSTVPYLTVI